MTWMNEYEIDQLANRNRFDPLETPKLIEAAKALSRYRDWVNINSDGWPYWKAGVEPAKLLMDRLQCAADAMRGGQVKDITPDEWSILFRPIRQFLGDQKVGDPDRLLFPPRSAPEPKPLHPSVEGTFYHADGETSQFRLTREGYFQWGSTQPYLSRTVLAITAMGDQLGEEDFFALAPTPEPEGPGQFTVVGYWDGDIRHVVGVIPGEHDVSGGDGISEEGPFAVCVMAADADDAENIVQGTGEDVDFD